MTLLETLKALEWVAKPVLGAYCLFCDHDKPDSHAPQCDVAAAIATVEAIEALAEEWSEADKGIDQYDEGWIDAKQGDGAQLRAALSMSP